jgi:hypothetical protein
MYLRLAYLYASNSTIQGEHEIQLGEACRTRRRSRVREAITSPTAELLKRRSAQPLSYFHPEGVAPRTRAHRHRTAGPSQTPPRTMVTCHLVAVSPDENDQGLDSLGENLLLDLR